MDAGDAEPSLDEVRRMVREIEPAWTVREATPAPQGTDAVSFVAVETPAGRRECVLKAAAFVDPPAFRPEPYVLALLDRRTSIPVPTVVGAVDEHDGLPAPFFLMDRCEGETREDGARDLPPAVVERIARDAGRHLGELHALGSPEAFGRIGLDPGTRLDRLGSAGDGTEAVDVDRLRVVDGHETWRARFEAHVDGFLGNLHERFADLEPALRAFVDERLDALDRPFEPAIGNDDYRLGNLLVDVETGETNAVVDWGNLGTTEPQYDLVMAEQHLCGWGPLDDPLRWRVRAAIRRGYGETNDPPRGDDLGRRRRLYLAAARLSPPVFFSLWTADATDAEREARAATHRAFVADLTGKQRLAKN